MIHKKPNFGLMFVMLERDANKDLDKSLTSVRGYFQEVSS